MNKEVNSSYKDILKRGTRALSAEDFAELANREDVLVLDTRSNKVYSEQGTIPGAWYIGIDGGFAPWVGALIRDINQKIILLADENGQEEVVTRLSRVGYDNSLGYLKGGLDAWKKQGYPVSEIGSISADEMLEGLNKGQVSHPLDLRKPSEFAKGHIENIENFALDTLLENIDTLDKNQTYTLHCQSGYRSLVAASILKSKGFDSIVDVRGGYKALKDLGAKIVEMV
jgi:rhodanese-related sulfurtransferase